jgi:hypothetical protein
LPDSIDRRQSNPEALLDGKIYTCDACHAILPIPGAACAWG